MLGVESSLVFRLAVPDKNILRLAVGSDVSLQGVDLLQPCVDGMNLTLYGIEIILGSLRRGLQFAHIRQIVLLQE